ncbi:sn-glycerol-3-phosphate ABC transporter ATP-binding protein [Hypericibacter adhaerens]|uniref:sn-glycerol-3-phosphate ABC transporter ATP-binding protein n=1 Tax=Hypericibacter adhaerens TaxID=2602016 RepID=A0A5J6N114_9PROT|nr:ABC transporter ATP-binding protein [Hypericibacter adhaerens]QEX22645.1 sn-glycerol-3-phosphate ABC transporter ATP-binding protein [Hypericibacter adhaerens]
MSVDLNSVFKRFGNVTAVNGVSVKIEDGEFFCMLGPSGCGKTTTLRMVAGLELPSEGQILIHGRDVTYEEPRHRDIAMAFQDYGLYPHMSVFHNIEFPLKVRGLEAHERRKKVHDTAERLGIAELLERKPGQLSGGQRQRVSLARALVRNPRVFLMDEPLSNLDAKLRASMRTEIKKLVSTLGITTIYVTHDQVEAMAMADRIAVMSRGDMVQVASPFEIYDRPRTHFVADFIGSPAMNMFAASVERNGGVRCSPQAFADALPAEERERARRIADSEGRLFIGVRPEKMSIGAAGGPHAVDAQVEFVEPLGQTTNVYVDAGGQRFVVVADKVSVKIGDAVGVSAAPDQLRAVALNNQ